MNWLWIGGVLGAIAIVTAPAPISHAPRLGIALAREGPIVAIPKPTDRYLTNFTRHYMSGLALGQETVVIANTGRTLLFTADGWVREIDDVEAGTHRNLSRIGGRVLGAAFVPGSNTAVVACDVAKGLMRLDVGVLPGDVNVTLLTAASDSDGRLITYCDDVAVAGGRSGEELTFCGACMVTHAGTAPTASVMRPHCAFPVHRLVGQDMRASTPSP